MGRLIDADELIAKIEEIYDGYMLSEDGSVVPKDFVEFLEEAPTVEAIPKDQYEERLKADMVAMLTELKLEIAELKLDYPIGECEHPTLKIKTTAYQTKTTTEIKQNCVEIIQQKINALKVENKMN